MSDLDVITAADQARQSALASAVSAIQSLQQGAPEVPDGNDPTVQAFQRQLFVVLDSNFWDVVAQALTAIESNQAYTGYAPFIPDHTVTDFAHVDGSLDYNLGITFGDPFFNADYTCQREVITHEFFHYVVGAQHHYGTTSTQDALACPHHLAELVFDIAVGEVGGCGDGATCF
ncbi:hypothetical protein F0L68_39335 [Solihabitans fulvus]|uniref:Lysine-specific metallo-endopeptidase domain-containing protein n=1 Tax=Solihabitans fulvus TaxID=1892852 RepID=A0A5B2WGL5_9PSEU|nr:hypothetical protein [Solihabitans fulvus]KAA2249546.1 hypothetical protein F0L68_39335 [Solihabitans fulvus]